LNPTPAQSALAQSILDAELALLKAKVGSGQTLRVGERRHLLELVPKRVDVREVAAYALVLAKEHARNSLSYEDRIPYWLEKVEALFVEGGQ